MLAQRERETAALQSAESQLVQAQTALEWQRSTLAGDIEQRKADVAGTEARLAELQNGTRPEEKADAKAAVDAAQAEVDRAKRDWDRAQVLHRNDDISTAQFDQFRSRWESATAALNSVREKQALVLAGAAHGGDQRAEGAGGPDARRTQDGGSQHAGNQTAGAGTGDAAGRDQPFARQSGAD